MCTYLYGPFKLRKLMVVSAMQRHGSPYEHALSGRARNFREGRLDHSTVWWACADSVMMQTQFSGSFFYPLCITFVKLSILFQYRRLFFHHSQIFHFQILALMVIVCLWGFGIIMTAFFLCLPMAKLWDPTLPGTCINIVSFYYGLQIPNIITDLLIIACPVREVLTLDLSKKMRLGAMTMFLLGVITLIFDIVRLVAMVQLHSQGPDQTCKSAEMAIFTILSRGILTRIAIDNLVHPAVWTTIEPTVAIVTVCIPSVRSLYRAKRRTPGNTSASTTNPGTNFSVQEVAKFGSSEEDVEIGELPATRSQEGLRDNAQSIAEVEEAEQPQQALGRSERAAWPPVTMLLDSERPFARFEEFDGRRKS